MRNFSHKTGPATHITDETQYHNRRKFLKTLGLGTIAAAGMFTVGKHIRNASAAPDAPSATEAAAILRPGIDLAGHPKLAGLYPANRNMLYRLPADAKLTEAVIAGSYNNFYEFTTDKDRVWRLAQQFEPDPWTIEVTGQCNRPGKFDIDAIHTMPGVQLEERHYRFRCVEAWTMDVPWTGFELNQLLKQVDPKPDAKYVRFITANKPEQMPGIKNQPWYPWPYFEALRIDEAMNPLAMMVTGIYGKPLPRQHGAPFRLIVPWKYGYKSPKSIVKIELVRERPKTFWETLAPDEYPFLSNVDPTVPHPRWSQASERVIGTGERRPTLPYNGYAQYVAHLYQ